MISGFLVRYQEDDQGTVGLMSLPNFQCYILELPWRDNKPFLSCIPAGEYLICRYSSAKYIKVYHITKVPDRSKCLIHPANLAGDIEKGFKTHVKGCMAPGDRIGFLAGQKAVLNSRVTMRRLKQALGYEPFILRIVEIYR